MATISQIRNKLNEFLGRTGLFSIGKTEFITCLQDMVGKISEINSHLNGLVVSDPIFDLNNWNQSDW